MLRKKHIGGTMLPYSFRAAQNVKQVVSDHNGRSLFNRSTDYGYSNWFAEQFPRNSRVKYKQYNRAVFVDIRELVQSLSIDYSTFKEQIGFVANTFSEIINDICYEYAVKNDFSEEAYDTLIAVVQEHYRPFFNRTAPSSNYFQSHSGGHWFGKLLGDRFSVTSRTAPPAMYEHKLEEAEEARMYNDTYETSHRDAVLSCLSEQTSPDRWRKMPLGVVGVMLPTDYFIGYLFSKFRTEGNHAPVYATSSMFYAAHPTNNIYNINSENYYWYGNRVSGVYYDIVTNFWIDKRQTINRRKYARCTQCRELHSVKFLDWYKTRSYSNNRQRICFYCVAMTAASYNNHHKAFVLATSDGNIETARYDVPRQYIHIDDSDEVATGTKDYQFSQVDNGTPSIPTLPIETRRYMAHMRRMDKAGLMQQYRYYLAFGREANLNRVGGANDDDNRVVIDNLPIDVFNIPEGNSRAVRIWTDHQAENRSFAWSYASRQEARVDDGWVNVDAGIQLNLARNNYSYRPDFYYVNNTDGVWQSAHTSANNRGVMSLDGSELSGSQVNNPAWHRQYGLFMGLELELIVRDNRGMFENLGYKQIFERTIETFHPQHYADRVEELAPQLLYAKYDGSLPSNSGVEYISQPMSMKAWQQVPSLFWHTVNETYKAFSVGGVGIHIHIPWAAFTEIQAYVFLSTLTALQENRNGLLRRVAQRASNNWTAWDELEYSNVPNTIAQVVKSREAENSSKYQGINLLHDNTIELRYFNSNAKGGRVLKNLEFVQMMYDYALALTDGYDWDASEDEIPPSDIISLVEEFRCTVVNCPPSTKDMIIDDVDDVHAVLDIEWKLMQFLLDNTDKYPNLHGYLTDTDDGSIELVQSELDAVYPGEAEVDEEVEEPTVMLRQDW